MDIINIHDIRPCGIIPDLLRPLTCQRLNIFHGRQRRIRAYTATSTIKAVALQSKDSLDIFNSRQSSHYTVGRVGVGPLTLPVKVGLASLA